MKIKTKPSISKCILAYNVTFVKISVKKYPEIKKLLDFSYGHYNLGLKAPRAQVEVFLSLRRPGFRELN